MAILNRRGNFVDFDPFKMLPGEFAYALDTEELYYCVSPGNIKRCATKEEVIEILETSQDAYNGLQQLLTELENETVATGILNDISNLLIKTDKNENDIIKINDRQIGTNLAIDTSQYFKSIDFVSDTTYLSPTGLSSLKAGDTITLSAYLSDISVESVALQIEFSDSGDLGVGVVTGDFVSADGLYTLTTTIPEGSAIGDIYAVLPSSQTVTGALKLKNLKLEVGSLVTPWKPSIYRIPTLEYKIDSHLAEYASSQAVTIIDFPFTASFLTGVATNTAKVTRVGKVITLTVGVKKSDGSVFARGYSLKIGQLPLGYRPIHSIVIPAGMGEVEFDISDIGYVYISTNGEISIRNSANDTAKYFYFSTSYIAN